jgi:hypothetical protein
MPLSILSFTLLFSSSKELLPQQSVNDKFASPYNSVVTFLCFFKFLSVLLFTFFDLIIFKIVFLLIVFLDKISLRII